MHRRSVRAGIGLVVGVGLYAARAQAQQYTLVDVTYEHTGLRQLAPAPGVPSNWGTPVDYRGGRVYGHLEILSRPSSDRGFFTIAILESISPLAHGWTYSPRFTTAKAVEWNHPFSQLGTDGNMTWTRKPVAIALIQKNDNNENSNPGHPQAARYWPTRVRVVVTFVPAGGTYKPPGPPPDGGAPGSKDASAARLDGPPGADATRTEVPLASGDVLAPDPTM